MRFGKRRKTIEMSGQTWTLPAKNEKLRRQLEAEFGFCLGGLRSEEINQLLKGRELSFLGRVVYAMLKVNHPEITLDMVRELILLRDIRPISQTLADYWRAK